MKTVELRSLLDGTNKEIDIPVEIAQAYSNWKEKRTDVVDPLEIFYAGYIMSNPVVRMKYRDARLTINNDRN